MIELAKRAKYAIIQINGETGPVEMELQLYGGGREHYRFDDMGARDINTGELLPEEREQELLEAFDPLATSDKFQGWSLSHSKYRVDLLSLSAEQI